MREAPSRAVKIGNRLLTDPCQAGSEQIDQWLFWFELAHDVGPAGGFGGISVQPLYTAAERVEFPVIVYQAFEVIRAELFAATAELGQEGKP